jgi:hypothetical protein
MSAKAAGGAGSRFAGTGVKMGRAAKRAIDKSGECIDEFMEILTKGSKDLLAAQEVAAMAAARVTKSVGGGRLQVQLQDGTNTSVPIAGTLKFRGSSRSKTDRANCMCVGDIVVVRGGFAAGKMTNAEAKRCGSIYDRLGIVVPAGFFAAASELMAEAEPVAYEWDRSEKDENQADEDGSSSSGSSGGSSKSKKGTATRTDYAAAAIAALEEGDIGAI